MEKKLTTGKKVNMRQNTCRFSRKLRREILGLIFGGSHGVCVCVCVRVCVCFRSPVNPLYFPYYRLAGPSENEAIGFCLFALISNKTCIKRESLKVLQGDFFSR